MSPPARRDVFQAIADPTRRDILNLLVKKELNLKTIASHFKLSRPAISQQIKILTDCGLLRIDQQGRERFCYLQTKKMKEVSDWLEPFKQAWEMRYNQLDSLLDELQSKPK
ncbi:MAG: metalloregulator ArsR/SmtB family transcription factor [Reichenbachiella sp.]|uniref:ArsR/SmtB family transcription factor n=1 Tax=Reichenbachiella sp. TaxID=2184521 RepID=UPI0032648A0D